MKIDYLKINGFGKIKNKEINFKDGINVVYGKNETGKSTLLRFILNMLYGSSKNKNGKDISDFEKYIPWDDGEFSGKMKYVLDNGERFEIYREFKKKNPQIFNSNLEDISKEFRIDKSKGIEFFEEQTGIDESTFLNTTILEQDGIKIEDSEKGNIIQKIGNNIETGDDKLSFKKVIDKINKQQLDKIGSNKSSNKPLNIVDERIKKLEAEKKKTTDNEEQLVNTLNEIEKNKKNIETEELKRDFLKQYKLILEDTKIEKAEIDFNKNLKEKYNKEIEEISKKMEISKDKKGNKKARIAILVSLLIELVLLGLEIKFKSRILLIIIIAMSVFNVIEIIVNLINRKNKNNNGNLKERLDILENDNLNKTKEIEDKEEVLNQKTNKERIAIKEKFKELLEEDFIDTALVMELDEINIYLENKEKNINESKIKLKLQENSFQMLEEEKENRLNVDEELEELYEEKRELEKLNNNFILAKDCLNDAYIKMKNSISPMFEKRLSDSIYKISDGKYKNIKFDDNTGLIVEIENGNYISADRLSLGTIDQMNMALRFSAASEISKEKLPVIFDESFVYYDDERLKNAFEYITKEFSNQIIILTCSKREINILNNLKVEYNLINLEN